MIRGTGPGRRRIFVAALSVVLAVGALGSCGDDKPNSDEPGSAPQDTGA